MLPTPFVVIFSLFGTKYITEAEETMDMISQFTVPGAHVVDVAPWRKSSSVASFNLLSLT